MRRAVIQQYSVFSSSQITCSEAHKGSGHEYVDLVIGCGQVRVGVIDIGRQVDEDGAHQWLPAWPVVGPKAKNGRGHHLTKTVGRHHPSQEGGIGSVVNL